MGATVLDHAVVGEGSIVGAGAVVSSGTIIPPRSLVVGIPAKVKKTLSDEDVAGNLENVEEYLELMQIAKNDPANQ
jgi:carbonic anhydrase/acetyltransferase-like protein (isoleucine patch superfamily)